MTDVDALVAWLREQIAEDRRIAEKAAKFKYDHPSDAPWESARLKLERYGSGAGMTSERFAARFTPARVFAQCDATEKILDELDKAFDRRKQHPGDLSSAGALLTMLHVVKIAGEAFADCPGYRDEWAPTAE